MHERPTPCTRPIAETPAGLAGVHSKIIASREAATPAGRDTSLDNQLLEAIFDAYPAPVFLTDGDVRVLATNTAGKRFIGLSERDPTTAPRRAGELLKCINALDSVQGCGSTAACKRCSVRSAVTTALARGAVYRAKGTLRLRLLGEAASDVFFLVSAAPLLHHREKLVVVTLEDVTELVQVKALLPMCASCRRVRVGEAYWHTLERWLREHHDVDFTHGLCDDCMQKLYPPDEEDAG